MTAVAARVQENIFGRDHELAVIRRALEDTAAGAGGCHVLTGTAGIGKSRLLRAAGDMADRLGIAVAAREAFQHDLAAPLVTLAGALRNCSPPTGEFRWLTRPERHDDPYLVLEQLRASLETFASRRPLLIVIDDAHWMDELSALAFRELVPALESFPVRWMFAARPDQSGAAAGHAGLAGPAGHRAAAAGRARRRRGGRALRRARSAPRSTTPCWRWPAAAAATRCGSSSCSPRCAGPASWWSAAAPRRWSATSCRRASSTPSATSWTACRPDARLLLQAGSVPTRPFGIEAAARLMRRDPAELFPLIDEATAAGLLTEDADGLAFAHDLVRQAVYSGLRRSVREQLHRDAALIARDERRPAREVAEHLLRSGRSGTAEAIATLRDAAAEVAAVAPATAADLIMHALDTTGEHDPAAARAGRRGGRPARLGGPGGRGPPARRGGAARRAGAGERGRAAARAGRGVQARRAEPGLGRVRRPRPGACARSPAAVAGEPARDPRARLVYVDDLAAADASGAAADRLGRSGKEHGAAVFGGTARMLVAQAAGPAGRRVRARRRRDRAGRPGRRRGPAPAPADLAGQRADLAGPVRRGDRDAAAGREESERLGTALGPAALALLQRRAADRPRPARRGGGRGRRRGEHAPSS